jgi:hypothetical protein
MSYWEIKSGQMWWYKNELLLVKDFFKDYQDDFTFKLETFKGTTEQCKLRSSVDDIIILRCDFFEELNQKELYLLKIKDKEVISITNIEDDNSCNNNNFSEKQLLNVFAKIENENRELRNINTVLIDYKTKLDKYSKLEKIFNDEKFMEDWLVRNIHKVLADLEVIDRQPTITWPNSKIKNRPDLFCLDKTTRELVIIENKIRGNKTTLETQYLTYRAWISENIEQINNQYSKFKINATEKFKFVIITDTTDEKLETICKHNRIPLILIDGGVIFQQIIPYDI